jgi:hypothetical protein
VKTFQGGVLYFYAVDSKSRRTSVGCSAIALSRPRGEKLQPQYLALERESAAAEETIAVVLVPPPEFNIRGPPLDWQRLAHGARMICWNRAEIRSEALVKTFKTVSSVFVDVAPP